MTKPVTMQTLNQTKKPSWTLSVVGLSVSRKVRVYSIASPTWNFGSWMLTQSEVRYASSSPAGMSNVLPL